MSINTENYTDSKGAQAHLGFLLFLILDLLSKDTITTAQSTATVFIGVAIPVLVVALILLPGEEKIKPWQFKLGIYSLLAGHAFGLMALTSILWGFNVLAGIVFALSSVIAFFVFSFACYRLLGKEGLEVIEGLLSGEESA